MAEEQKQTKKPLESIWTQQQADGMYRKYVESGYTPEDATKRIKQLSGLTPSPATVGQTDLTASSNPLNQKNDQLSQLDLGSMSPDSNYNFDGDYALVKFTDDPTPSDPTSDQTTVWFYNRKSKTFRPFASMDALTSSLQMTPQEVVSNINTMPTTVLNTPSWQGTFLKGNESIKEQNDLLNDWFPTLNVTTPSAPSSTYGATRADQATEETMANMLGTVFTSIKRKGEITENTFNKYLGNASNLMTYVNASLYGGYTADDIYRDLKAKELADSGNTMYSGIKGIDTSMKADQWYQTEEYKKLKADSNLSPNISALNMDPDLFNNPFFKIPGKAFSTLVEPIDWSSPEFQAEAEKIQASFYDVMMQKSEATTEQGKAIADNNYDILKKNIEKKYGIQLSNNANTAWNQLNELFASFNERGLGQSGFFNEAMDKYLAEVRKSDQYIREANLDEQEQEQRDFLLKTGSPEQINEFVQQNPEQAQQWGLIPSEETKNWFSYENLKQQFPSLSDQEINNISNMILDESGNFRSQLYQNLYSNKYDLSEMKNTYQQEKLLNQKMVEEEKAYAPYTKSNPLSSYQPSYGNEPTLNDLAIKQPTTEVTDVAETAPKQTDIPIVETPKETQPVKTNQVDPFKEFTKGKIDILGKNWGGYKAIQGSEYQTPEQRSKWKNVQQVGKTLYGYYQ